eukprot:gene22541-65203_t
MRAWQRYSVVGETREDHYPYNTLQPALGCIAARNPVRRAMIRLEADSSTHRWAVIVDWFFVILFLLEAVVKLVARGLVMHRGAYLRSAWNVLDFGIVVSSVVSSVADVANVGAGANMSALRCLRVARPLG